MRFLKQISFVFLTAGLCSSAGAESLESIFSSPKIDAAAPAQPAQEPTALPATPALTEDQRQGILELFTLSWQHGLNPDLYQADLLAAEMAKPVKERRADLNDLFFQSAIRYVRDLSGMRVRAGDIGLRAKDWRVAPDVPSVMRGIAGAPDMLAYLRSVPPQTPLYRALQNELVKLADKLKAGEGERPIYPIKSLKRSIRPGDTHPIIAELRTVLGAKMPIDENPSVYDDILAQVVMEFQRNHGLKDDGVIGKKTIRFFNQTNSERYQQVIANLERLRWLDPVKPPKYIVVNIPAATLWGVENDAVVTEMPVIVGRTKRPTAQFKTMVQGVRFNPTWTVPDVIKKEDFLPELRKDPSFLAAKGVEVWQKDPETGENILVDPLFVDWENVTEKDLHAYRMVQPSGSANALGLIRVIMPNQYDIYLHDTNTPEYFRDDDRDISSGCVRLSRPRDMARFVLSGEAGWTDAKMHTVLESGKTRDVTLANRFPVILLYQTAWMKKGGQLVLAYDIYQEDIKLYSALRRTGILPKFPT